MTKNFKINSEAIDALAEEGHLDILKWLHCELGNEIPWNTRTMAKAARRGHFEVVKWSHENGCPWDSASMNGAAFSGNLEMVIWIHTRGCPSQDKEFLSAAAEGEHVDILEWASDNGFPISDDSANGMASRAAKLGVGRVLSWLITRGMEIDFPGLVCMALQHENLPILQTIFGIKGREMFTPQHFYLLRGATSPRVCVLVRRGEGVQMKLIG